MSLSLSPGERFGEVTVPASKSQAHRMLICAALGKKNVTVACKGISKDIQATVDCLNALGANIVLSSPEVFSVTPIDSLPTKTVHLPCGESGTTLRLLLPVTGALGVSAVFHREGRLPERPLSPLDDVLIGHGMTLKSDGSLLHCSGTLSAGEFSIAGNVSSQYISGLLLALPYLSQSSTLHVTGAVESAAYITMTEDVLRLANIAFDKTDWTYRISGNQTYELPSSCAVEGDYSNAAFFLCAGALSTKGITVKGLSPASHQGDQAILDILRRFGAEISLSEQGIYVKKNRLEGCVIDAAPIPDLIPVLSVVASLCSGTTHIVNGARLRLKESDRIESTAALLGALGGVVETSPDTMTVHGMKSLAGGSIKTCNDHRIAMSAAVAACGCTSPVLPDDEACVQKSYPRFWTDFDSLQKGAPLL